MTKQQTETKRQFSGARLYKLTKRVVISVTVFSALVAAVNLYQIESNNILNTYLDLCKKYEGVDYYYRCMLLGFEAIDSASDIFYRALTIAILLPATFFGGAWLYKYLFLVQEPERKR